MKTKEQELNTNKKPKKKVLLLILIVVLTVILLAFAVVAFYYVSHQNSAKEKIALLYQNNKEVYLMSEADCDAENENEYIIYCFSFKDDSVITGTEFGLHYINDEPDYKNFYDYEEEYSYHFNIDLQGNVTLTSDDGGFTDLSIETDKNHKIMSLYDEYEFGASEADTKYVNDMKKYISHKEQYKNIDKIESEFLSTGYRGYSTTWKEVFDKTFLNYETSIDISDDYEPETAVDVSNLYENGYVLTISGEYSINPVQLPDVTREGTLVLAINSDVSQAKVISDTGIIDACDVYVATGTNWYMDEFSRW